jgi:hypothetical protein
MQRWWHEYVDCAVKRRCWPLAKSLWFVSDVNMPGMDTQLLAGDRAKPLLPVLLR